MELNIIIFAMIGALILYMIINRMKMVNEHLKALDEKNHKGDFKRIFTGWPLVILYSIASVASITGIISFYLNRANYENYVAWILVFIVTFVTSSTDVIKTFVLHSVYYNEQGIFHNTDFFKYKSIKNFKPKKSGLSTEVFLFNGQSYLVPTRALQQLEDRMVKAKNSN